MATQAQIRANQQNARRSTGPRTATGKFTASRNAIRHGFRSQTTLIPGEDIEEYEILLAELEEAYQPINLTQTRCIREMADADWRLRRVRLWEEVQLRKAMGYQSAEDPNTPLEYQQAMAFAALAEKGRGFTQIIRYETKFERQYDRAFKQLREDKRTQNENGTNEANFEQPNPFQQPKAQETQPPSPSEAKGEESGIKNTGPRPPETGPRSEATPAPRSKPGRNAKCPCGSGLKYKRCHGNPVQPAE